MLGKCQIFIVKGRKGCHMKARAGRLPVDLPVTPFRVKKLNEWVCWPLS